VVPHNHNLEERLSFEQMLSSIAASFVNLPPGGVDEAISGALDTISRALVLRGAAIFQPETQTLSKMTHATPGQWFFKLGEPFDIAKFAPLPQREVLRPGELLVVRPAHVPEQVVDFWKKNGVGCEIVVPMVVAGENRGCILLRMSTEEIDEALVERTRLLGDVIAHALVRKRAEDERAAAFAELAARKATVELERDYLREQARSAAFVVESPALRRVVAALRVAARTSSTILLRGETGVGKEVLARALHEWSHRAEGPLVRVNCASIPRELFESEFFGHVRGAFTGAHRDRIGRFELADGGTLFLDEIGEVPLELQPKLLRVLQEGELERVGDDRTRRVDVRVITATNRVLEREVQAGRFRSDLYYRLAVFPVLVPPLRERVEDIVPLARLFLAEHARRVGHGELELTAGDERALMGYPWPGNVRELANVIERAVILSNGKLALDLALPSSPLRFEAPNMDASKVQTFEELRVMERDNLVRALEASGGQIAGRGGAAERLGLSPSTLRDRMRMFGVAARRGLPTRSAASSAKGE
jgi:transcriptional regulator with GAF, ATPase, and Fis domain